MSYKIAQLAGRVVNLLTLESVLAQNLLAQAAATNNPTVITTVHPHTHSLHAKELAQLATNPNIRIVPYYAPLLYAHHASTDTYEESDNPPRVSLLIGDNNPALQAHLDPARSVTLEELCRAFPEKVPLSGRSRDSAAARERLEKRIGMHMSKEHLVQFENLLLINPTLKNWDEAIQVTLDSQPSPIYIPYHKNTHNPGHFYRLTATDFLGAVSHIHSTVSTVVKTHPPLKVVHYTEEKQLDWISEEIANQAQELAIDSYFFADPPTTSYYVKEEAKVINSLREVL